jgi:hypothetical protein
VRSLEDIRRIHHCPLQDLVNEDNSACALQADKVWAELGLNEVSPKSLNDKFEKRIENIKSHMETVIRCFPGEEDKSQDEIAKDMEAFIQRLKKLSDERKNSIAKFFFLVDIYEGLYDNPWMRRAHIYKHLEASHEVFQFKPEYKTSLSVKLRYILFPMVVFFLSFGFQSFMLHITTHYYIYYMDHEEGDNERKRNGGELLDVFGNLVGELAKKKLSDQGAVSEGKLEFPIIVLDATAAIPLVFCMLAYAFSFQNKSFNIGLWNKTFIVASLMAIIKGVFDAVTIMPDSTGWKNCKTRLTKTGLQSLRDLDFLHAFWSSLITQLLEEIRGSENGRRVRYCADMMVSGHTYFACLFSLSAYKQIAFSTLISKTGWNRIIRHAVFAICLVCMFFEVALVAAARFHYTVDMLGAILLVFLLFDSRFIEQLAADWSEGWQWRDPDFVGRNGIKHRLLCIKPSQGNLIPSQGTCFNHRLIAGNEIYDEPDDALEAHVTTCASVEEGTYVPLPLTQISRIDDFEEPAKS